MEGCTNQTQTEQSHLASTDASLSGVINLLVLPGVCAFGIVGNMLNLAILTRRKLKKSIRTLEQAANLCLIYLAMSDLLFCVFVFPTTFLPADNTYTHAGWSLYYATYSYGIINVFIMESTMLTVAMSLERYLAICFPLRQDIYLTTNRIKVVIPVTFLFSLGFNIPVFMRYKIVALCANSSDQLVETTNEAVSNISSLVSGVHEDFKYQILREQNILIIIPNATRALVDVVSNISLNPSTNISHRTKPPLTTTAPSSLPHSFWHTFSVLPHAPSTLPSISSLSSSGTTTSSIDTRTVYTTKIVPLGGSNIYDIAYRIIWAFVGNFIPLFLLLYFNFCLCRKIYCSYKHRKQLGRHLQTRSSSHILTMTLVAIVVLFLILVAPSEVTLQITHLISSQDRPMYRNIEAILNLMQAINFSGNFILYCIISPYFRKTLKYMLLCGCYNVYHVSRHSRKEFHTSLL